MSGLVSFSGSTGHISYLPSTPNTSIKSIMRSALGNGTENKTYIRDLARNFKTCLRDFLLGATWHPGMKNVRTGTIITSYGLTKVYVNMLYQLSNR